MSRQLRRDAKKERKRKMKLIDEIIKYAADKKNRKIMTAAENDLRANIAFYAVPA